MKILSNRNFTIKGECVMLDRLGTVYNCIDNLYHPNPGTEADGYSEIERTVDWLYQNNIDAIKDELDRWVMIRVAQYMFEHGEDVSLDDILLNVMYCDDYTPSPATVHGFVKIYRVYQEDVDQIVAQSTLDDVVVASRITHYLNENFLRVRAGGKLNPEGTNSIYFRISSHKFNWRKVIIDFLLDTFSTVPDMPETIWVVHDAETNPPEKVLFRGTASDLFDEAGRIILANRYKWV